MLTLHQLYMQIKSSSNEATIKEPAPLSSYQHKHTKYSTPRKWKVIGMYCSAGLSTSRAASPAKHCGGVAADGTGNLRELESTGRAAQQAGRAPRREGGSTRGSPLAFPRPTEGGRAGGRPPHLEEVILVHHAAAGQGLHQLAGEGGLASVGDPAARAPSPYR